MIEEMWKSVYDEYLRALHEWVRDPSEGIKMRISEEWTQEQKEEITERIMSVHSIWMDRLNGEGSRGWIAHLKILVLG